MKRKRKHHNHSASFMAKEAVAAIRGDKTMAELSEQFDVHQNQVADWRRKLLDHTWRTKIEVRAEWCLLKLKSPSFRAERSGDPESR